ncbi:hypothetical protein P3X46_032103 [Hevea brasiliensis]|uniref:Glycosyltransferase n=1 Tax=Hevea brasiliensis TaxID=3981 RepID=A0ABQ9KQG3_HEVBR|nr:hypothetical protein P3X46_032103 [Hevea brasiliensis]
MNNINDVVFSGDYDKKKPCSSSWISSMLFRRITLVFLVAVSCLGNCDSDDLESVLRAASMKDKTVILTSVNIAMAKPGFVLDVFLESFKIGNNTKKLLNHLVIITLDQKAYARCLAIHPHCFALKIQGLDLSSEAFFMTPIYLEVVWAKIHILATVLQKGYNFVFTDADVMWVRDPFPHFYEDADFCITSDAYYGNPSDRKNLPNSGFMYVKSNQRTMKFYKYWYSSRKTFPGLNDQDVFNKIKYDPFTAKLGLQMKYLDTAYFGGFCEFSKDFNKVCTMHANCCIGMERKIHDLKMVLEDWRRFMLNTTNLKPSSSFTWRAPEKCR